MPTRLVATVMTFGSEVLISGLSLELMDEAYRADGFASTAAGFLGGAPIYTLANWLRSHHGAKHRKRPVKQQPSAADAGGSGAAIALP